MIYWFRYVEVIMSCLSSLLQVTKATGKFLKWSHAGPYKFDDWNGWRMKDGMLCRTTNDCSWLDENLLCQNFTLSIERSNISQAWFGENASIIEGKCKCGGELVWYYDDLECAELPWSTGMQVLFWLLGMVGVIVLYCVKKKMKC